VSFTEVPYYRNFSPLLVRLPTDPSTELSKRAIGSMLSKKSQTALRLISRRKTNHATIVRRYAPTPVTEVTGSAGARFRGLRQAAAAPFNFGSLSSHPAAPDASWHLRRDSSPCKNRKLPTDSRSFPCAKRTLARSYGVSISMIAMAPGS
jgi:hypothetical protein